MKGNKFFLSFSILSIVFLNATSQVVVYEYYSNGSLKLTGMLSSDSLKLGDWKEYYDNGKTKSLKSYKAENIYDTIILIDPITGNEKKIPTITSKKVGRWKYYDHNGVLVRLEIHRREKVITREWYESGNKKSRVSFKNGIKEGYEIYYYPNGVKESKTFYRDGKPHGLGMGWHENGNIKWKARYKDGEVIKLIEAPAERSIP